MPEKIVTWRIDGDEDENRRLGRLDEAHRLVRFFFTRTITERERVEVHAGRDLRLPVEVDLALGGAADVADQDPLRVEGRQIAKLEALRDDRVSLAQHLRLQRRGRASACRGPTRGSACPAARVFRSSAATLRFGSVRRVTSDVS